MNKTELLEYIISFYLSSGDFNGVPIYNIENYNQADMLDLIDDGLVETISENEAINPHIKGFDFGLTKEQHKDNALYEMPNSQCDNSYDAALEIIENFKKWVEYHRGASVINGCGEKPSEKLIQRMIYAVGQMFCDKFNWCFSPETDSGRGPADFVISRGTNKTIVEVKLTSNQDCVHGLEIQIEEYAVAENTDK